MRYSTDGPEWKRRNRIVYSMHQWASAQDLKNKTLLQSIRAQIRRSLMIPMLDQTYGFVGQEILNFFEGLDAS